MMSEKFIITESVASGLKTRFFSEMIEGQEQAVKVFTTKTKSAKNRNNFKNIALTARKTFKDYIVQIYEGGSLRKPYVVFDLLTVLKDREYNTWHEKCLIGCSLFINYEPDFRRIYFQPYSISEHVISRLFLRTQPVFNNGLIDCKYIKNEFKYIPLWSNFWQMTLLQSDEKYFEGCCYPVIPSTNGLFLCEYSKNTQRIEIRTFVHDLQLSYEQIIAKKMLNVISNNLHESPLSFVGSTTNNIDDPQLLNQILARRILIDENYQILKNVFFHRIEDDVLRMHRKKMFDIVLKNESNLVDSIVDNFLNEIGVVQFQLKIKEKKLKVTNK